jgi:uncharacterized protein with HEPN domain
MTEREKKFLCDIVQATKLVEEFTAEIIAYENYCNDLKTQSAVERQIVIIGEAVNKYNQINHGAKIAGAKEIIGLRNRLVHAYDSIDNSIIWVIIKKHLQPLRNEAEKLLSEP